MQKVAVIAYAYCGSRVKVHHILQDMYGPDDVALYVASRRGDPPATAFYSTNEEAGQLTAGHEIVHVFSESCALPMSVMQARPDGQKRIIFHQHDIASLRPIPDTAESWLYSQLDPLFVFTSEPHREYQRDRYQIDPSRLWLIPNMPLRADCQPVVPPEEKYHAVIYYGGLRERPDVDNGYRYYLTAFRKLASAGWPVHIYPAPSEDGAIHPALIRTYGTHPGIRIFPSLDWADIYRVGSHYALSFVGYNGDGAPAGPVAYARTCTPNKVYDPVAMGTPVLGWGAGHCASIGERYGEFVESLTELPQAATRAAALRLDWETLRERHTLDSYKGSIKHMHDYAQRGRPRSVTDQASALECARGHIAETRRLEADGALDDRLITSVLAADRVASNAIVDARENGQPIPADLFCVLAESLVIQGRPYDAMAVLEEGRSGAPNYQPFDAMLIKIHRHIADNIEARLSEVQPQEEEA